MLSYRRPSNSYIDVLTIITSVPIIKYYIYYKYYTLTH
jgi:hypothetical protein